MAAKEREDRGVQIEATLGQPILVPVGAGAVAHALEQAVLDELGESLGEHVACDPEVALQLSEAVHPEVRVAHDQERPAVGQQRERALRGGRVEPVGRWVALAMQLVAQRYHASREPRPA